MALAMYQYRDEDIENKNLFNVKQINKRFKYMAKCYHPDKAHGDYVAFVRLEVSKRILLSIADPDEYEFPYKDAYKLSCCDELIATENMKAIKCTEEPHQQSQNDEDSDKEPDLDGHDYEHDKNVTDELSNPVQGGWGSYIRGLNKLW